MKRPEFIKNYKDLILPDNNSYAGSKELLSLSAPVGKALGLKQIGVHIEVLNPGRRTSWPHAESAEEEFAYVISGHPQVWVDGHLHDLSPGDFVAFPAGTGIAHCFMNNSEKDALLLVGGEASKKENKCIYPLNPNRNEEIKKDNFLWEDVPKHELGPHDGLPDLLRAKDNQ
jgi:uncharacterized cupin superfamily protein